MNRRSPELIRRAAEASRLTPGGGVAGVPDPSVFFAGQRAGDYHGEAVVTTDPGGGAPHRAIEFTDDSGNGRSLPMLSTHDGVMSTLGGAPAVELGAGGVRSCFVSASSISLTSPVSIFAAFRLNVARNADQIFGCEDYAFSLNGRGVTGEMIGRVGGSETWSTGTSDAGVDMARALVCDGTNARYYDKDTLLATRVANRSPSGTWALGARSDSSFWTRSTVGRVVIVTGTVTATQLSQWADFVADKYGI